VLDELARDRLQRNPSGAVTLLDEGERVFGVDRLGHGGDLRDRARFEQRTRRDGQAALLQRRRYPDRADGVAAQSEKIIGRGQRRIVGDPEHLPEGLCHSAFRVAVQCASGTACTSEVGDRQRRPVELAVLRQRQLGQLGQRRGNHVFRQGVGQHTFDRCRVLIVGADRQRRPGLGHVVGDQHRVGSPFQGDRRRGRHTGHLVQGRGDLTEFDAVAAHLDLVVGAAQILKAAAGVPAHDVAGAVHPRARVERAGDEGHGSEARPAVVALRQLHTTEVELARPAWGHLP
jgi:hypothetical protein